MRKDMARLIVKGHAVPKDRSNRSMKCRDWEDLPDRESMRQIRRDQCYEGPRDRLEPLQNFLKSNVGRIWADVYKEICEVTDLRSFEGKHLREHIDQMVIPATELAIRNSRPYGRHYWEFYEDSDGILQRYNKNFSWRYYKPRQNPDECVVDGVPFVRINNCWFEAAYYENNLELEWQLVPGERKRQLLPKRYTRAVRQLNKKELKRLGLSNTPGWRWYERHA